MLNLVLIRISFINYVSFLPHKSLIQKNPPHDHHYLVNLAALPNARPTSATFDGETRPAYSITITRVTVKDHPGKKGISEKNQVHTRCTFGFWTENSISKH